MTTPQLPFEARLIGQTQKTLHAILEHLLTHSGMSDRQWIALTITLSDPEATGAVAAARVATALKVSEPEASDVLETLAARGLIAVGGSHDPVTLTPAGRDLHAGLQSRITDITDRLWSDISAADQRRAAAVLNTTLGRAAAELELLTPQEAL